MKQTNLKNKYLLAIAFLITTLGVKGQTYRMELGVMGGNSFYMGDANNNNLFEGKHPSFGLLTRYNLNDRFALKANALVAGISGTTVGAASTFYNGSELNFDRSIIDAGVQLEVNFFSYGAPDYKPGSSRFSPYLLVGLGLTGYKTDKTQICANIPFGLGLKVKVAPRINMGCEWSFRKTTTDDLDYVKDASGFQLQDSWSGNSSWKKNKDWYSMLHFYVSYDIYGIGSKCFK